MLPALISAGASLLGGLLNKNSADKANETAQANALRQEALQREFAQNGIKWKVEDAKQAGIHPIYALGANTVSYSPTTAGSTADTSLGSAIASSGQDISRAMQATRNSEERQTAFDKSVQALSLQKMGLENELLSSQIAKMRGQIGPPMPALTDKSPTAGLTFPEDKPEKRPVLGANGMKWETQPGTANADDYEKRYGEISDFLMGPAILWNDMVYNSQKVSKPWWGGETLYEKLMRNMPRVKSGASARGRDEAFRRSRAGRW